MVMCPFVILVDSAEQQPWRFQGFKSDSRHKYAPVTVEWRYESLGRHPNSTGDYSIEGFKGVLGIERKSMADCQTTLLGFNDGHRERFEQELANLAELKSACVIVEATMEQVVQNPPDYGTKTRETQAKILFRSLIKYQQDYPVPWIFAPHRRWAETVAFRWMERFFKYEHESSRAKKRT